MASPLSPLVKLPSRLTSSTSAVLPLACPFSPSSPASMHCPQSAPSSSPQAPLTTSTPPLPPSPLSPPSPAFSSDSSDADSSPSSSPIAPPPCPPFHPLPILPPPHLLHCPLAPSPPTLTGRAFQRYADGRRLVCGAIPFVLPPSSPTRPLVLALRPAGGDGEWIFPKGGWESFESGVECAAREVMEEAGVGGRLVAELGEVEVRSGKGKVGRMWMWAMQVERQYERWNDGGRRERRWMGVGEAREAIRRPEMREMLERLHAQLQRLVPGYGGEEGREAQTAAEEAKEGGGGGEGEEKAGLGVQRVEER